MKTMSESPIQDDYFTRYDLDMVQDEIWPKKKHNSTNKKPPFLTNKCRYQTKTNSRKQSTGSNRINKQNHVLSTISMMMDDVIVVEKKNHACTNEMDGRTDIRCYVMRHMRAGWYTKKRNQNQKKKRDRTNKEEKADVLHLKRNNDDPPIPEYPRKKEKHAAPSFVRSFVLPVRQRTCEQKTKHNHHPRQW